MDTVGSCSLAGFAEAMAGSLVTRLFDGEPSLGWTLGTGFFEPFAITTFVLFGVLVSETDSCNAKTAWLTRRGWFTTGFAPGGW